MSTPKEFDEIRPYDPEELPEVLEELIADPEFRAVAEKMLPDTPYEEACARLRLCRTNLEVQQTFFYPLLKKLIRQCSDGFRMDCTRLTDKSLPHTFITNHRDIVTDPAFLSIGLLDAGFGNTVEIAIGDNLLIRPWIKRLVRVDKAFIVQRSAGMRQMLESSTRLGRYMHYAISTKGENIWIAQRQGRAKDADDRTQEAVLKMMAMGGEGSTAGRLRQLHLVPIALSYEYDPCDYLKAQEMQQKRDNPDYRKTPQDDLTNMQTGIFGKKGRICFRMAECLDEWLDTLPENLARTELLATIAARIDRDIHLGYTLYPGNYIAADLLDESNRFAGLHYTPEEKERFTSYVQEQLQKVTLPQPDYKFLRQQLLTMYANPLRNQLKALKEN